MIFRLVYSVPALMFVLSMSNLGATEPLKKQFLEEAPKAWKELRLRLETCHTVAELNVEPLKGLSKSEAHRVRNETYYSNGKKLHRRTVTEGNIGYIEDVLAINDDYAFNLRRNTKSSDWIVRHVGERGAVEKPLQAGIQPIEAALTLDVQPIDWTVAAPGFKLHDVNPTGKSGELLELSFSSTDSFRTDYSVLAGRVTVDPKHFWVICQYSVDIQLDILGKTNGEVQYTYLSDGLPVPKRMTKDQIFESKGVQRRISISYDTFVEMPSPDETFRLTAFGLPEPRSPSAGAFSLRAMLAVLAVSLITAAVLLRRVSQRAT